MERKLNNVWKNVKKMSGAQNRRVRREYVNIMLSTARHQPIYNNHRMLNIHDEPVAPFAADNNCDDVSHDSFSALVGIENDEIPVSKDSEDGNNSVKGIVYIEIKTLLGRS